MKLATRTTRRRSTADKDAALEAHKAAVKRLQDLMVEYKQRMTPEQQAAIDEAAEKLEGYSHYNKVLIVMQANARGFFPSAVAAASIWHKAGHIIKKGEKAIRILAPIMKRKVKPEDGAIVPEGYDFTMDDLKADSPIWFKDVPVFDISQTEEACKELRLTCEREAPAYGNDSAEVEVIEA